MKKIVIDHYTETPTFGIDEPYFLRRYLDDHLDYETNPMRFDSLLLETICGLARQN